MRTGEKGAGAATMTPVPTAPSVPVRKRTAMNGAGVAAAPAVTALPIALSGAVVVRWGITNVAVVDAGSGAEAGGILTVGANITGESGMATGEAWESGGGDVAVDRIF